MINQQNDVKPTFSYDRDMLLYTSVQQSLNALILDIIDSDMDTIVNLLSEGNELLEMTDSETNGENIATIVRYLNSRLHQHTISMNVLKYKCGGEKSAETTLLKR